MPHRHALILILYGQNVKSFRGNIKKSPSFPCRRLYLFKYSIIYLDMLFILLSNSNII
ncbi:hypothetical protein GCWU000341_00273 [Oribacterium sp. oral taxon 078 str. F0262]|nr:hypothetical protein GCWU000341_00273 [Oribacterium sp. oral taxon 078 str. F0262]